MRRTKGILVTGMVLALAGCALGGKRVATAPRPQQSVSVDIVTRPTPPMGAAPGLSIPAIGPDGQRITPNRNLGPSEALWHVRSALNVAALGCGGGATTANYNRLLATHKVTLAKANIAIDADYQRRFGAKGVGIRDVHNTKTYNFFALPPVQRDFCRVAAAVGADALGMDASQLIAFAPTALARLEKPFFTFFDAYAEYQAQLKGQTARAAAKPAAIIAAPKAATIAKADAPRAQGGFLVQIGAVPSNDVAKAVWKAAQTKHDILDGRPSVIGKAQANGRTVYRVAAGGFATSADAKKVCESLKAHGTDCFARANWNA